MGTDWCNTRIGSSLTYNYKTCQGRAHDSLCDEEKRFPTFSPRPDTKPISRAILSSDSDDDDDGKAKPAAKPNGKVKISDDEEDNFKMPPVHFRFQLLILLSFCQNELRLPLYEGRFYVDYWYILL